MGLSVQELEMIRLVGNIFDRFQKHPLCVSFYLYLQEVSLFHFFLLTRWISVLVCKGEGILSPSCLQQLNRRVRLFGLKIHVGGMSGKWSLFGENLSLFWEKWSLLGVELSPTVGLCTLYKILACVRHPSPLDNARIPSAYAVSTLL